MALTPVSAFTPDTALGTSAGPASAAVALPGTPASDNTLLIVNLGSMPVAFKLGSSNAVTCTMATGTVVMPGQSMYVGMVGMTYIALTTGSPGTSSTINLTTGS